MGLKTVDGFVGKVLPHNTKSVLASEFKAGMTGAWAAGGAAQAVMPWALAKLENTPAAAINSS